ncbi:MAG TPA: type I-U CRISPR-associated helicase/endonuclease Cas3, partial [Acidimicrobiales bacterium]|nr:type I-U CRISPR-associated helicase/endonuclease Cas3 [Acidimicrobiales bacterium]
RPLEVVRLRGGGFLEREWVRSPAQPTVVVSTVDQIGSRLLFRGYGHGRGETNDLSVQAGLTGCDAIVFLDEAHLSHAFLESARAVAELRTWQDRPVGAPWAVVALTATPREARSVFPEPSLLRVDETESALGPRLRSHKSTTFREVPIDADLPAALADEAEAMVGVDRVRVIAVVANRVLRARAAFERLRQHGQEAILLTGRVRPLDRDRLVAGWLDRIRAGRDRDEAVEPLFVVATQTIEVGADLDFDGVVTEVAALDALRQRLGRLDRLGQRGESPVVVVASKEQLAAKAIDPIYGAALRETGRFLKAAAARAKQTRRRAGAIALNLGWNGLEALLASEGDVGRLVSPASHAPVLLPSHLDLFAQTSPLPTPDPDVAAYLHGLASEPADVRIVWRADLEPDQDDAWTNIVSMCPPQASEGIELPVWTVRRWLAGSSDADAADVEGERASSEEAQTGRRALRWTSPTEAELVEPAEIRPGDTLVVPSEYGGCDAFGWHPTSREPVADLAEEAAGGDFLRLHPRTLGAWLPEEARVGAARGLAAARGALEAEEDGRPECGVLLATLAAAANTPVIRETAAAFLNGHWNLLPYPDGVGVVVLGRLGPASAGRGEGDQAAGRPVTLAEHTEGVTRRVAAFARAVDLADSLAADLVLAARLHDLGKCDPRMQAWLHAGDRLAVDPRAPLAKSGMDPRNRAAWRAAREQAGYPRGARHEALSVALVADSALLDSAGDRELVLHLIGSHHGTA